MNPSIYSQFLQIFMGQLVNNLSLQVPCKIQMNHGLTFFHIFIVLTFTCQLFRITFFYTPSVRHLKQTTVTKCVFLIYKVFFVCHFYRFTNLFHRLLTLFYLWIQQYHQENDINKCKESKSKRRKFQQDLERNWPNSGFKRKEERRRRKQGLKLADLFGFLLLNKN